MTFDLIVTHKMLDVETGMLDPCKESSSLHHHMYLYTVRCYDYPNHSFVHNLHLGTKHYIYVNIAICISLTV